MWTAPLTDRALRLAGAVGLSLAASAAVASPSDGLDQFLAERGLAAPAAAMSPAADLGEPLSLPGQPVRSDASGLVVAAMNFLGVPYRRGGDNEQGFDCSGFTRHLFESSLGLLLPRRAEEQAHSSDLMPVARSQLQPGDLVFFNTLRRTFSHVGIYVGEGRFIHAPRPGADVRIENMRLPYWNTRFTGARRPAGEPAPPRTAIAPTQATAPALGFPPMY